MLRIVLEPVDDRRRTDDEAAFADLGLGRFDQGAHSGSVPVDGKDAERLVTIGIHVEKDAVVVGPRESGNVPVAHPGDGTRFAGFEIDHGNIPPVVDRRDSGQVLAVRR